MRDEKQGASGRQGSTPKPANSSLEENPNATLGYAASIIAASYEALDRMPASPAQPALQADVDTVEFMHSPAARHHSVTLFLRNRTSEVLKLTKLRYGFTDDASSRSFTVSAGKAAVDGETAREEKVAGILPDSQLHPGQSFPLTIHYRATPKESCFSCLTIAYQAGSLTGEGAISHLAIPVYGFAATGKLRRADSSDSAFSDSLFSDFSPGSSSSSSSSSDSSGSSDSADCSC